MKSILVVFIILLGMNLIGCSSEMESDLLNTEQLSPHISTAEFMNGKVLVGDIIVEESKFENLSEGEIQSAGYSQLQGVDLKTWKGGIVPVKIDLKDSVHKDRFWDAADKWKKDTGIKFVHYNASKHNKYLQVIDSYRGCYAEFGEPQNSKFSIMNLDRNEPDCRLVGVIMHEMAHVLGMLHEHQRFDRDQFVDVRYENIDSSSLGAFEIIPGIPYTQYDFSSITHYDDKSASKNNRTTISVKSPYSSDFSTSQLGDAVLKNAKLSLGDKRSIRQMYNVLPKECLDTFPMAKSCKWRDVLCSAKEGELVKCFSGAKIYKVNLDKEFSNGKCVYGKTYFIDERPNEDRLYVTGGCDADFGVREAVMDEEVRPHSGCGPQTIPMNGGKYVVRAPHGEVGDVFTTLSQENLYDAFNQLHYKNLRYIDLKCQSNGHWKIIEKEWRDNPYNP